jgi:hypothetical protein
MLRVDVPDQPATKYEPAQPGFTRLFGPGAIYSIAPVSEEIARRAAASMRVKNGLDWEGDEVDDDDGDDDRDDV